MFNIGAPEQPSGSMCTQNCCLQLLLACCCSNALLLFISSDSTSVRQVSLQWGQCSTVCGWTSNINTALPSPHLPAVDLLVCILRLGSQRIAQQHSKLTDRHKANLQASRAQACQQDQRLLAVLLTPPLSVLGHPSLSMSMLSHPSLCYKLGQLRHCYIQFKHAAVCTKPSQLLCALNQLLCTPQPWQSNSPRQNPHKHPTSQTLNRTAHSCRSQTPSAKP